MKLEYEDFKAINKLLEIAKEYLISIQPDNDHAKRAEYKINAVLNILSDINKQEG